jgi:hypothetical protein
MCVLRAPASRSPSRWPGTVRSAMLAGRSAIKSGSTVCPRVGPFVVPRLLRRMRRCAVSSRLSTPRAWTHRLHTFRLVRQLHRRILGIGAHEPARDLCRRPLACEFRPDQAGHHRQLASLRPARPRRRVRLHRPIRAKASRVRNLATHRQRCTAQRPRSGPHGPAYREPARNGLALFGRTGTRRGLQSRSRDAARAGHDPRGASPRVSRAPGTATTCRMSASTGRARDCHLPAGQDVGRLAHCS